VWRSRRETRRLAVGWVCAGGRRLQAAALNPFRFSTKRTDPTTDLVLYEYRAYSSTLGRWLSRDPLAAGRAGWPNGETMWDPIGNFDWLGLLPCCICSREPSDCWIAVEWVAGSLLMDFFFFPDIQPPLGPGRFLVQMGVKVAVRHRWLATDGCHLRQDTRGQSSFPIDGKTEWETAEDYSSHKSTGWPAYHGWYYYDRPRVDVTFASRPEDPQTCWWQAHVYVEEAPGVETWWGFAATAAYQTIGQAQYGATRWSGIRRLPFSVKVGTRIE